jgi:hypothetical protein
MTTTSVEPGVPGRGNHGFRTRNGPARCEPGRLNYRRIACRGQRGYSILISLLFDLVVCVLGR